MSAPKTRTEHDLLGTKEVPADAYYGVQTARGLENFNISGTELRLYPNIIKALGMVKLAAARANFDCGQFSKEILKGHGRRLPGTDRGQAPRPVPPGRLPGRRRHLDEHERERGHRESRAGTDGPQEGRVPGTCSPHDHANGSQSTNDAYPTALHVGMALGNRELIAAVNELIAAFRAKGKEFGSIIKMGRTQLQDAVPMTLGQEFNAFGGHAGRRGAGARGDAATCSPKSTWAPPRSARA